MSLPAHRQVWSYRLLVLLCVDARVSPTVSTGTLAFKSPSLSASVVDGPSTGISAKVSTVGIQIAYCGSQSLSFVMQRVDIFSVSTSLTVTTSVLAFTFAFALASASTSASPLQCLLCVQLSWPVPRPVPRFLIHRYIVWR